MNLGGLKASGMEDQMLSIDILFILIAVAAVVVILCICLFAYRMVTKRLKKCEFYKQQIIIAHNTIIESLRKQLSYSQNKINDEALNNCGINFDEYEKLRIDANINTSLMNEKERKRFMILISEYPKLLETLRVEVGKLKTELIHLSEAGGPLVNFCVWVKRKQFLGYKGLVDNIGEVIESNEKKRILPEETPAINEEESYEEHTPQSGTSIEAELARLQKESGHAN